MDNQETTPSFDVELGPLQDKIGVLTEEMVGTEAGDSATMEWGSEEETRGV